MNIPNYYYRDAANREIGPLPLPALAQLRQAGILTDATPVRAECSAEWIECCQVIAVTASLAPPATGSRKGNSPKFSKQVFIIFVLLLVVAGLFGVVELRQQKNDLNNGETMALPNLPTAAQIQEQKNADAANAAISNAAAAEQGLKSSRIKAMMNNLRLLANAAQEYMMAHSATEASYNDIIGIGTEHSYLHSVTPVMGEDYTSLHIALLKT